MKKYTIIAYAECDEGYLPRQEKVISAKDWEDAISKAWREFPEYHEVGAFEIEDKEK